MKKYLLKTSGLAILGICMATGMLAQEKPRESVKRSGDDIIIVKPKGKKESKITIEIKDGEVKVNGKPLSEFKDDNISITRRKEFSFNRDLAAMDAMGNTPRSRFRNGSSSWSFSGDEMPAIAGFDENKAFLGVTTEKEEVGVKVTDVTDESAAEKAGIKEGDVITKINDEKIDDPEELSKTIGKFKPEEKVTVTILRDKKEQKLTAALGKRNGFMAFTAPHFKMNEYGPLTQAYGFSINGRGKLGLKAQETEDGKGLKVLDVDDESPAEKAGIKEGDIITEFDGTEVNNIDKLRELSKAALAKPSFKVKINREGKSQDIDVKIPKNLKSTNL